MSGRDGEEYVTEEQARELWRRAAQLQAEAADRRDARIRRLAADADASDSVMHVSDVETAAAEAGIPAEFMRLARAETIGRGSAPMSPRWEALTTRLLGNDQRFLEVSRIIEASPRQLLEAIGRAFPANPYYLNLLDTLGDPVAGGVLIFEVTRSSGLGYTSFTWEMALADIRHILVVIRPFEGEPVACDVVLGANLNYSRRLNFGVGSTLTGAVGLAGGTAGTVAGVALGIGALTALTALAGAAGSFGLATLAYRKMFRWSVGRGRKAIEELLRAIDVRIRAGDIIPPARPDKSDR